MKRYLYATGDWLLDRLTNPKGYYDDGERFRTFRDLLNRNLKETA